MSKPRLGIQPLPRFPKERDMREPVTRYLIERGFLPAVEFWLHGCGQADIVAGLYAKREGRKIPTLLEVVAIELKLSDFAGVLKQAARNKDCCDWSYIAMPSERIAKMRAATKIAIISEGIGLLSVDEEVRECITPARGPGLKAASRIRNLWRRVSRVSPATDADEMGG